MVPFSEAGVIFVAGAGSRDVEELSLSSMADIVVSSCRKKAGKNSSGWIHLFKRGFW